MVGSRRSGGPEKKWADVVGSRARECGELIDGEMAMDICIYIWICGSEI